MKLDAAAVQTLRTSTQACQIRFTRRKLQMWQASPDQVNNHLFMVRVGDIMDVTVGRALEAHKIIVRSRAKGFAVTWDRVPEAERPNIHHSQLWSHLSARDVALLESRCA